MRNDTTLVKTEEPRSNPWAQPREAARRSNGGARRRAIAREFPGFLIRLVGERRLRRLPAEDLRPHRYD